MNRVVLKIILRLGRYAVLPVVALACVILALTRQSRWRPLPPPA
ncbi:hypothetical protein [Bradyrhizobium sp.]|jgi:hypothetical protein|nr:hypothetical protein [Bradyrhizobium sp.]HEV2158177.1 hypothetical protein [Bradyrhizobium sp.]